MKPTTGLSMRPYPGIGETMHGNQEQTATPPTLVSAVRVWAQIGILSFGGPTAQIALMHRIIVDERKWLTEQQFLNALGFCMLLPGPEAMQIATYAGWRLHGIRGGLTAGLLFVLPGACIVLVLSTIYAAFGNVPLIEAMFLGIKAAVLVIVIEALLRIVRRALAGAEHRLIAALSFVAIFFFAAPYPLLILGVAIYGYGRTPRAVDVTVVGTDIQTDARQTVLTMATWLIIWLAPLGALMGFLGKNHLYSELALFFSKLAVVTFGGAYAVLAYMGQDIVVRYGWLEAGQMMDGLGLAETTPGPLILVTEFAGYLAAYQHAGGIPVVAGIMGAGVALWMTFAPCFLWIFTGAPYIEWINAQPRLNGALSAIMAAIVGVIMNLAVWFALHVFFGTVTLTRVYNLNLWVPDLSTVDWRVVGLAAISGILLLVRHWSIPCVLAVAAMLSLGIMFVSP